MRPIFVGRTNRTHESDALAPELREKVWLTKEDLVTHIHGVGATRSGKSKWIEWFCRQLEGQSMGFTLIDPQGALSEDLLHYFAYRHSNHEIVYFNPSRDDYLIPFNPFRASADDISTRVAKQVEATLRAWGADKADETPTLNRLLYVTFYLFALGIITLSEVYSLFSYEEKELRAYVASRLDAYPIIQAEWQSLASASLRPRDFQQETLSIKNRLFRLVQSPHIRRIMSLEASLNLGRLFDEGGILIVNLQESEYLSAENATLIGTLIINELWAHARRRTRPPAKDYFLLIDEVQRFFTPDLRDILDRGAGKGLHLGLFHQHLTQLKAQDQWTYDSVMGNAKVKLAFGGLTRENAQIMVDEMFAGQIDLNEIKFYIEQTKFWPVYGRDKSYTKSHSTQRGSSMGAGSSSTEGVTAGLMWDPSLQEFVPSESVATSAGSSEFRSESESETYSEGESDVPIFYPVPFKEESSRTLYSLEEQKHRLADGIMNQFQSHYFLRRPGHETIAVATPYVKTYKIFPDSEDEYVLETLIKPYALAIPEIDQRLEERRKQLLETATGRVAGQEIEPTTRS